MRLPSSQLNPNLIADAVLPPHPSARVRLAREPPHPGE